MRVAVTGGAGFIGHHLVDGLVAAGDAVTVIDDLSSGDPARLAHHGAAVRLIDATILDATALEAALAGSEVVFHHAAVASVAKSFDNPMAVNEVNVTGTIAVIVAAARLGVRRVILASSSAVYGTAAQLPCTELQRPEPVSPYGAGKLAAEHYLHTLGARLGVETVALRYFNVFGPAQDPASEYAAVVPRFITAVVGGASPVINGSGDITRDYVYVDDVVRANLLAAHASVGPALTCNIAGGRETSLIELLNAICTAVGRDVQPVFGPPRPGDIQFSRADIERARATLGFEAGTSLAQGIRWTVDWFRGHARTDDPGLDVP